ncbi:tetratricopeptide repeat protein [Bowmanella sp. Y26]|uniref:tetratricopeptide repeat protein n=1 Tax=Bowmanella yangjiangensis TaxID=2811230 RepID=UPI001BDC0410|nr:tetratricopeptide repeat protein [Bowmanella yangjiangensis]MBT1064849.1 tetratricopeptide repeat protein [Bowmanella yangjiangensis]
MKKLVALLFLNCLSFQVFSLGWFGNTLNGRQCEGNSQGFGPYDYFEVMASGKDSELWNKARLWEIDRIHYGKGNGHVADKSTLTEIDYKLAMKEYDYTLRAYPNHVPALQAVMDLERRRERESAIRKVTIVPFKTPPECYFQRAIQFQPGQAHLYLAYAVYLHRQKQYELAEHHYREAYKRDENPETAYNLGLLLFNKGDYDEARRYYQLAREKKFPLDGLDRLLKAKGH